MFHTAAGKEANILFQAGNTLLIILYHVTDPNCYTSQDIDQTQLKLDRRTRPRHDEQDDSQGTKIQKNKLTGKLWGTKGVIGQRKLDKQIFLWAVLWTIGDEHE